MAIAIIQNERRKRSDELRMLRLGARLTMTKLSELSDLSKITIHWMETGKRGWNIDSEILYRNAIIAYQKQNA